MVIILTDSNIKDAVNAWYNGDTTTYGPVSYTHLTLPTNREV